jgi:hypothetical protein
VNATITYETALERHPVQVAEILKDLAKSRSKDRDLDPTHFTWTYNWGISVQGCSLADLLSGNGPKPETRTLAERIGGVTLRADKGRKGTYAPTTITVLPPEVLAYHEEASKPRQPDPALANLSVEELVAKLPGLVCIKLRRPEEG